MTAACATDEAPTRHTRTDVQRRESDDLSTGTGSENSMDKTLTMARSADSSSGAGARALARRPSNRRQNTSFFRVRVVFRARQHRCCRRGKRVKGLSRIPLLFVMERARTRSQAGEPETAAAPSDAPEVPSRPAAAEVPTHGSISCLSLRSRAGRTRCWRSSSD